MKRILLMLAVLMLISMNTAVRNTLKYKVEQFEKEMFSTFSIEKSNRYIGAIDSSSYSWSRKISLRRISTSKNFFGQLVHFNVFLSFYFYEDKGMKSQALSRWYNHFNIQGIQVEPGVNQDSVSCKPRFVIINANEVIVVDISCEHRGDDWDKMVEEVKDRFAFGNYETISVGCNGPLIWKESNDLFTH